MSVINQVLKDLDRQGANTRAPSGVVAVNQPDAVSPWPRRIGLAAGVTVLLAAIWWFWRPAPGVVAPPPLLPASAEPQLRLSQELTPVARPSLPSPAEATVSAATPAPVSAPPPRIAFVPQPPRLDTRLPEPRQPSAAALEPKLAEAKSIETKSAVVKEIKPATPQVQAEEAWRQANRLLEQGRNHDARERLEVALRLDPEHDAARQSLVALLLEAGNVAPAEALLREGITLQPNDPWYPRSLAQMQLQRGDLAAAAAGLKAALGKRQDAANWALYAGTLHKLGKSGEAATAYREAVRLDPSQGNWWIGMAVALEQSGDAEAAGATYQRALQTRLGGELREFAQQKARALNQR